MEISTKNAPSEPLGAPSTGRKMINITIVLPQEIKDESEAALKILDAETTVRMAFKGWVAKVYVTAWKSELEKFRKRNSP